MKELINHVSSHLKATQELINHFSIRLKATHHVRTYIQLPHSSSLSHLFTHPTTQIIAIDHGKVLASGTFDELLAMKIPVIVQANEDAQEGEEVDADADADADTGKATTTAEDATLVTERTKSQVGATDHHNGSSQRIIGFAVHA